MTDPDRDGGGGLAMVWIHWVVVHRQIITAVSMWSMVGIIDRFGQDGFGGEIFGPENFGGPFRNPGSGCRIRRNPESVSRIW